MNQTNPSQTRFEFNHSYLITIAGLLAALVAIFVFKVLLAWSSIMALIGAMILSHFWMHAGHTGHGEHQEQSSPVQNG